MELTKDIITACLLFRENNYSFSYSSFVTTAFGDVDENRKNVLYSEFANHNVVNLIESLANRFQITIHFVNYDKTVRSREYGFELFMRRNEHLFWFHSNCGRMINLPAGVNKLNGCCHRLDEILNRCGIKCKIVKCPLRFDGDLTAIETKFNISFNIWEKTKQDGKYNIVNVRRGTSGGQVIDLHRDLIFNKLFLITAKKLYFRSFIRKLNINK